MDDLGQLVENLTEVVGGLGELVAKEREDRLATRRRDWRLVVTTVIVVAVVGFAALGGAYALILRNNRAFCGIVQVSARQDPPPTTVRGRNSQREAQRLADRFGCP